jgi:urease accessory protein
MQVNEITVAENALLEYLPDPIIPFRAARFSQATSIRLAQDAGLFWWEILSPGREAHGEIFEYECAEMRADLIAMGRSIAADRIRLKPRIHPLPSLARLGQYRTWCTFYICRVGVPASAWLGLEQELREVARGFTNPDETLWGISMLVAHGLVVRGMGQHGRNMLPGLQAIWSAAKRRLYGRDAVPPRKVN